MGLHVKFLVPYLLALLNKTLLAGIALLSLPVGRLAQVGDALRSCRKKLERSNLELAAYRQSLEQKVKARAEELNLANENLQMGLCERIEGEETLQSTNQPILIHFGDSCAPGIIINDILNIRRKNVFQLAMFWFDTILNILNDNALNDICDKKYLIDESGREFDGFKSEIQKFGHDAAFHNKYKIKFIHDFIIQNNNIMNYDFVRNMYQEKIKNFNEDLNSNRFKVFINFTKDIPSEFKLNNMVTILAGKIKNSNFVLLIFTSEPAADNFVQINNLKIIHLKQSYNCWFQIPHVDRIPLYKEIYNEFKKVMNSYGYEYNEFEDSAFFKKHNQKSATSLSQ